MSAGLRCRARGGVIFFICLVAGLFIASAASAEKIGSYDSQGQLLNQLERVEKLAIVLNREKEALTEELKNLRKEKYIASELSAALEEKNKVIGSLKKENRTLTRKVTTFAKKETSDKKLLDKFEDKIKSLKKKNDGLAGKVSLLSGKTPYSEKLFEKLEAAEEEIEVLKKNNIALSESFLKPKEDKSLSKKLKGKEKKIESLNKEISLLRKKDTLSKELLRNLKQAEKETSRLKKESAVLNKQIASLRDKKDYAKSLSDELKQAEGVRKRKKNPQAQDPQELLQEKITLLEKENAMLVSMGKVSLDQLRKPDGDVGQASQRERGRQAYVNLGYLYARDGKHKSAIKEYLKVLKYDQSDKDARYNLGFLYAKINKFKKAVEYYEQSLRGTSQDRDVYYNLAVIYARNLQDLETAVEYYKKSLNPNVGSK